MIRTKIVVTMGPACEELQTLRSLLEAGTDVCRLNFSHGTLDDHLRMLRNIRQAVAELSCPLAILGDLSGPKIRLGKVEDIEDGGMPIEPGEQLVIQRQPVVGAQGRVSTTYPGLIDDVEVGHRVFVEDGMLRFICTSKDADALYCNCTAGGVLQTAKGVNLPDTHVSLPSITAHDWKCAAWAVEQELDYLALSFVRSADDLHLLRQFLKSRHSDIQIIAKMEKAEAIEHMDPIIEATDGLMVARGDLGVELDLAQVPIIQKDLIRRCQIAGKPVIVATQMLQSMIHSPSPTRAEVSDVANAIFDGTDAIMLSGETAVGKFPVGAVHMMSHVADITEDYLVKYESEELHASARPTLRSALARGVYRIVRDLEVEVVVLWSQTGATARVFSKHRFPVPIIALSSDPRALRRMSLHYGVIPHQAQRPRTLNELVERVDELVVRETLAEKGQRMVIVTGSSVGTPGMINGVVIHTVGDPVVSAVNVQQLQESDPS